jgi:hypothetical protein
MRACRHCSHQNADHLSYCSRCGRRLPAQTILEAGAAGAGLGPMAPGARIPTSGMSRTMLATPVPGRSGTAPFTAAMRPITGRGPAAVAGAIDGVGADEQARGARRRRLGGIGWIGESIGYIYVYTRGKLDAGERRRRLGDERDGAQAMLAAAIRELGGAILRDGIQHPELTGLLEEIGRAGARREGAAGDIAASERQKESEEARLAAAEAAAEVEWRTCDATGRDADDILRTATDDHQSAAARLGRVRDERARLGREADAAAAAGSPEGRARAASLRHDEQGLAAEAAALAEQTARLERELADLREKSAALRAAATRARSKLDQVISDRRQAASTIAASIAGHVRDRAEAEREVTDLTEQLGRAAGQRSVRPPASSLLSAYQRIDRLEETIEDRAAQLAALDQSAAASFDQRKLLTGVGLLTSMLAATAAALWAVLK